MLMLRRFAKSRIAWLIAGVAAISQHTYAADANWVSQAEPFTYKGGALTCEMRADGGFKSIRAGDVVLLDDITLHGRYDPEADKHDSRFFQNSDDTAPLLVRKDGENQFTVKRVAILKNAKYADGGANYTQTTFFSPNRIELTYEVEQIPALASYSHIFTTLNGLPATTFGARGIKATMMDDTAKTLVLPETNDPAKPFKQIINMKNIKFSLETGVLEIAAGENTSISIMDSRTWGGNNFRVDIQQTTPWSAKLKTFPAGLKYKWTYVISFNPNTK